MSEIYISHLHTKTIYDFANYNTNQVAIDAQTIADNKQNRRQEIKNSFDNDVLMNAFLEQMIEELNDIRSQIPGLGPLQIAQIKQELFQKIDSAP